MRRSWKTLVRYVQEERIAWPVLIDDLAGTVQRAYGGLAAAVYLIDSRGSVAFCGTWGQSPALRHAIDDLLARGGTGVPPGRASTAGRIWPLRSWPGKVAPLAAGRQALIDLELGFPGAMILMALGRLGRPALAPLARVRRHCQTGRAPLSSSALSARARRSASACGTAGERDGRTGREGRLLS